MWHHVVPGGHGAQHGIRDDLRMDAALIVAVGIGVVLTSCELQQFLVTVLKDALQYTRQTIAILPIVAARREKKPHGG